MKKDKGARGQIRQSVNFISASSTKIDDFVVSLFNCELKEKLKYSR